MHKREGGLGLFLKIVKLVNSVTLFDQLLSSTTQIILIILRLEKLDFGQYVKPFNTSTSNDSDTLVVSVSTKK